MHKKTFDSPIIKIAILIAMQGEADPIIKKFNMETEAPEKYGFHPQLGLKLYRTTQQEKEIFLVVNGYDALHDVERVGTQAAAITAFTVIEKLKPDTIINAPIIYHDRRITLGNYARYGKGSFAYLDLIHAATALDLKPGVISSGSSLDASADDIRLLNEYDADVVDMEAAAIAEIAARLGVRMIALKSITNFIDDNIHADFEKNYSLAVNNLSDKLAALITYLLANSHQNS
jgi:5'-methylthioadenosine nucleosidase